MSANFQSEWKTSGFFSLNLEKLPNYVQYFGLNIAEGVVESWVEVDGARWSWVCGGWRWMELGGAGWRWIKLGGGGCTV